MRLIRQVVVFDASDIDAESSFWAGMYGGRVVADDDFHCIIDSDGQWRLGVQRAPNHVAPEWPDGRPQQVHLDLHVDDPRVADARAVELGASVLLARDDFAAAEGHRVYADPAGHPFCIGWGQPDENTLRLFLSRLPDQPDVSPG